MFLFLCVFSLCSFFPHGIALFFLRHLLLQRGDDPSARQSVLPVGDKDLTDTG